jgi:hypothetical protein
LRYLLVAESPPDPGEGERRFFYSPALTADNLYRSVAEAVYGEDRNVDLRNKPAVLDRLRQDGFWLIDAVETPVNKLRSSDRARAIKKGAARVGCTLRCSRTKTRGDHLSQQGLRSHGAGYP